MTKMEKVLELAKRLAALDIERAQVEQELAKLVGSRPRTTIRLEPQKELSPMQVKVLEAFPAPGKLMTLVELTSKLTGIHYGSLSAALSQLKHRGLVRNDGRGLWTRI